MRCPQCGTENDTSARFCAACGQSLDSPPPIAAVTPIAQYCGACGARNEADARFCESCGAPLGPVTARAAPDGSLATGVSAVPSAEPAAPADVPVAPADVPLAVDDALRASTPPAAPHEVRYAGVGRRVLARLIDTALLCALIWGVELALGLFMGPGPLTRLLAGDRFAMLSVSPIAVVTAGIGLLLAWYYWARFDSSRLRGTPGRFLTGARITTTHLGPVSFVRASWRFWVQVLLGGLAPVVAYVTLAASPLQSVVVAALGFVFLFSYALAAGTPRSRALHDVLAGTMVVRRGTALRPRTTTASAAVNGRATQSRVQAVAAPAAPVQTVAAIAPDVQAAPKRRRGLGCAGCLWLLLVGVLLLAGVGAGGYLLVQSGQLSTQRVIDVVGLGAGEINVANLSDASLTVTVTQLDAPPSSSSSSGSPRTLTLAPREVRALYKIDPGRYQLVVATAGGGPQAGSCTLKLASGDIYRVVAVRTGTAITRERSLPLPGGQPDDLNLATSPLCKA